MDIIGLAERKLNKNTHEAILWLSGLINASSQPKMNNEECVMDNEKRNYQTDFEHMQSSFLSSSTARNYAESRNLNWKQLQIGYNAFKAGRFNYLRGCIAFGLRDRQNSIVSMYGRSIRDNDKAKHYYTTNRKGLYPSYPPAGTKKLILTESVIDTATLLMNNEKCIIDNVQPEILALYGTNGLTTEHVNAIQQLETLNEIILFFDGDEAGRAANEKHGKYLKELLPELQISVVETPEEEDINSLSIGHENGIFMELLKNRKPFSFSIEKKKAVETPRLAPTSTSVL